MDIKKICSSLRSASQKLALQNACDKNAALSAVALALDKNRDSIIAANKVDIDAARSAGMSESIIDRLLLDDKRIDDFHEKSHLIKQKLLFIKEKEQITIQNIL